MGHWNEQARDSNGRFASGGGSSSRDYINQKNAMKVAGYAMQAYAAAGALKYGYMGIKATSAAVDSYRASNAVVATSKFGAGREAVQLGLDLGQGYVRKNPPKFGL